MPPVDDDQRTDQCVTTFAARLLGTIEHYRFSINAGEERSRLCRDKRIRPDLTPRPGPRISAITSYLTNGQSARLQLPGAHPS
jgi:hypothetical protein